MKILVVGPSWVGDSVMAQTLYKRLKYENPDCVIDVMCPEWCLPLTNRMPEVNKGIISPYKHGEIGLISRYKYAKELKENAYDRSIILANSLKSSLIPLFAQIPIRTGWLGEMRYFFLNDIRKLKGERRNLMVEKFAALSIKKGDYSLENLSFPSLQIDTENQKIISNKYKINNDLPCLAICPGAEFGPSKKWPSKFYAEVAKKYIDDGWNILCFGSQNDKETGEEIETLNDLASEDSFFNLVGETSLEDAIDLLALCKKVVTNDSGLMHVAAAVGRPIVALYGPSSPDYTPPLTSKKIIIRKGSGYEKIRRGDEDEGYHRGLMSIKPAEVINALETL